MKRAIACLLLAIAAGAGGSAAVADDATAHFQALYAREWAWREQQFAGEDDEDQTRMPADHLPNVGAAAQAEREKYWAQVMTELGTIDENALGAADQVNYEVYQRQIAVLLENQRVKEWQMPLNSDTSFWTDLGFAARRPYLDAQSYRRYLSMLGDVPRYFDEQIANMRLGLQRGFCVPRVTLAGRDQSIADVVDARDEKNLFYQPFLHMPGTISVEEQAQLRAAALVRIRTSVIPAYHKLLVFMRGEYMPKARTTLAAEALPDGVAYYRSRIREFTTLDWDPDKIHALGLAEVARIHQEMQDTIAATGFKGSFAEFLNYLRTDPRFAPKTADELLMRAAWIAKRVDGKIGQYIGLLPRHRFGIEPVPPDLAPFYTAGRGGMGTYFVNTFDLPSRSLPSLTALTLHESSPGHSLQMSLAFEQENLPKFRRYTYISAFGEGWALYSEYLGLEMGLYDTPYDRFGYLSYQMWRACRLVVDTGIHHLNWTRAQALAYLRDNTALSEHEIETETDRYIGWPGQALSYYLGMMQIKAARARAEQALGSKFDVRAFHDAVLALGSVPLPVIDRRIDRFIADGGRANPDAPSYAMLREVTLGGPGGWDYLLADPGTGRLFISRGDRVLVVNAADGTLAATIPNTAGVHGIALAPDLGLGFTSNGHADTITVFDLASLRTTATVPVRGENPDAILYDPASRRVYTFNGRSNDISIIDPAAGSVLAVLPAGGKPEFAAADGSGRVFYNIEDTGEIGVIDTHAAQRVATWKLSQCERPTGLALDRQHARLFSVCANGSLAVTDANSGKPIAQVPIGQGPDAAAYDPERGLVFSSNGGDGTLTIIHEDDPDHYKVLATLPTQTSARTMALDPQSHRIYLVAAEFGPAPAPTAEQPHPRGPVLDGSFKLLVVGN
jgi:YVTN family beta-propeller protein